MQATSTATAGKTAGFRVTVSNAGGTTAAATIGVNVSSQGGAAGNATLSGDGWTCAATRCTTTTDVAPGAALAPIEAAVPVVANRTTTSTSSGRVLLSATVDGGDDTVTSDNSANATTGIRASTRADLGVVGRVAGDQSAAAGGDPAR
ncbi:MAG TPA: hypothetical protein VNS09_13655 [Solirubrobacter sp.]|nr:hypothetical protein [Solirubrobacter sp.]